MIKKLILLLTAMGFLAPCNAEKVKVDIKSQQSNEINKPIKRSPMNLPIEVIFDTETHVVEVSCASPLEGEVYI